jgi:hypothetical protein
MLLMGDFRELSCCDPRWLCAEFWRCLKVFMGLQVCLKPQAIAQAVCCDREAFRLQRIHKGPP